MALKRNEAGFTFVSLLCTLIIILISMPLILLLLQKVNVDQNEYHIAAHHFFIFLYNDTLNAEEVYIKDNVIHFVISDFETATIETYNNMVRRRVEGRGHEIYLRNITSLHVSELSYGYRVKIIMDNGEEYEKTIAT